MRSSASDSLPPLLGETNWWPPRPLGTLHRRLGLDPIEPVSAFEPPTAAWPCDRSPPPLGSAVTNRT